MYDADGYLGFTFAGHHSSEFGLLVVSDGSRYHQNLSSAFNDSVMSVPGYNGNYYFGTQISTRDFEINCAFDELSTHMRDEIQQWLYPNKIGWLIFDEAPYKKYLVKISSPINFSYLPFNNYNNHKGYYFNQDILKGELSISFFSFNEYGIGNEEFDRPIIVKNKDITQQILDSGLIPKNYNIKNNNIYLSNEKIVNFNNNEIKEFYLYNAGNGIATADFYFNVTSSDIRSGVTFFNYDDGQSYILKDFSNEDKLKNYNSYIVKILGTKKEIWAYGINNGEEVESSKTNIGGYYNQYYPKIYHTKPTEILIVSQTKDSEGNSEATFYPAIYSSSDYRSSDSNQNFYYFDEFKYKWSDYKVCTEKLTVDINDVLNPATLYINLEGNNYEFSEDSFIYLIYPNKFQLIGNITNFTPIYENTYI